MEDILTMSQKESKRLYVIRKAIDKRIKQRQAADILELSQRQIRRLVKRVRQEQDKGIIHRSRGRRSHRAIPEKIKDRVLGLCRGIYAGFNPTLASEKLFERNKIKLSRETLRQWFITKGVPYERRKVRPHRRWRERKAYCGEMVQMDGSHHDWLEGRGPRCVLMGYIDDASNRAYARFYSYEGTLPALDSFKHYCLKYGLPQSLYLDRHSTYKGSKQTIEDELLNRQALSHFGKALAELDVSLIHAQSAPAKGRVERLFKTFQDRLVKEMRLRGISSIVAANKFLDYYLPVFNSRFNVEPLNPEDLHRPLLKGLDLDKILSAKTPHVLHNDFTIAHKGKLYQIEDNIRAKEVVVEERSSNQMYITYKGRPLRYKQILLRPKKIQEKTKDIKATVKKGHYVIPWDHPWKRFRLPGSNPIKTREEVFADAL